jgi:hypothetical protein
LAAKSGAGGKIHDRCRHGIGVELDWERVGRYAELYDREAASFAFHDLAALTATPVIPKH